MIRPFARSTPAGCRRGDRRAVALALLALHISVLGARAFRCVGRRRPRDVTAARDLRPRSPNPRPDHGPATPLVGVRASMALPRPRAAHSP